mmetsp:Transcript_29333/g.61840  ORF Transcript_29333/g.61840 Transcript_29333/m.61840 type:complete len:425 (+) Transcript_29333:99-1373(+)
MPFSIEMESATVTVTDDQGASSDGISAIVAPALGSAAKTATPVAVSCVTANNENGAGRDSNSKIDAFLRGRCVINIPSRSRHENALSSTSNAKSAASNSRSQTKQAPDTPPTPYDPNETGRVTRPRGHYSPGMFAGVKSVEDFAAVLRVPLKAIPLVVPKDKPCRSKGCPHNAIEGNSNYCPAHQRSWYPLRHTRGGHLFGPEFLRFNGKFRSCSCDLPSCKSAGYFPGQDALYIPSTGVETVLNTPNLFSPEKKQKLREKKFVYLYAWHFLPDHRIKDYEGLWELNYDKRVKALFYDIERNVYNFPPPCHDPCLFVEEEFFSESARPLDRWAAENKVTKMPAWMLNILASDARHEAAIQKENHEKEKAELENNIKAAYIEEIAQLRAEKLELEDMLKKANKDLQTCKDARGRPRRYKVCQCKI